MKKLLIILLLFIPFLANTQIISASTPNGWNMEVYKPNDNKLPVLFFFPGLGEVGYNRAALYVHGPLRFIRDNNFSPDMLVIACQTPNGWTNGSHIDNFIKSAVNQFNIDTSRIYFTGLSAGAGGIYSYIKNLHNYTYKPRAVVPMSLTIDASCGNFYQNNDYLCDNDFNWQNVASWGICGRNDSHWGKMNRFFMRMEQAGFTTKWTTYQGGHDGWNNFYDPNYKELYVGSMYNIYDWVLLFKDRKVPVEWISYSITNNIVTWVTTKEENVAFYEIEESTDGNNFEVISERISPKEDIRNVYTYNLKK